MQARSCESCVLLVCGRPCGLPFKVESQFPSATRHSHLHCDMGITGINYVNIVGEKITEGNLLKKYIVNIHLGTKQINNIVYCT